MGFEEEMTQILQAVPENRQTVFFSATFPQSISQMSRSYQKDPVRVTIEEAKEKAPEIRQVFYEIEADGKFNALIWLLQQNKPESSIIFCNLKATVIDLNRTLNRTGVSSVCLHGDMEQADRDRVMAKFRNQSARILVATDVAARGIDIANLDAVINFDIPQKGDTYVHRIGRTGRAGKKGLAITLVNHREKIKVQNIQNYSGFTLEEKKLPPLENLNTTHFKESLSHDAQMATLYIAGGRKDKMRPGDILGALTGEAGGLNGSDIGKIEIHDRFSYVAVSKSVFPIALQRLRDGRIKGKKFKIEPVR
jgi:ATP-independent RNA helicase DbpA